MISFHAQIITDSALPINDLLVQWESETANEMASHWSKAKRSYSPFAFFDDPLKTPSKYNMLSADPPWLAHPSGKHPTPHT